MIGDWEEEDMGTDTEKVSPPLPLPLSFPLSLAPSP